MNTTELKSFVVEQINSGVIVLDAEYNVVFINKFVEVHCGVTRETAIEQNLFDLFPELPVNWLKRKLQSVFLLNTPAFGSREQ